MVDYAGLSPKNPLKYLGPNVHINTVVMRKRQPTGADYRQPETGKYYPRNCFWLVGDSPTTGTEGDLWYLSKIEANVGFWVKLGSAAGGPLLSVDVDLNSAPGTDPVLPTAAGLMTIQGGATYATGTRANPIRTHSLAANAFDLQIQLAGGNAGSAAANNFGVIQVDTNHFTITNGFLQLKGAGQAIDSVTVDNATGPGVNPVLPDAAGNVTVNGAVVAAHSVPVDIHTRALNKYNVEVQVGTASAAPANKNGAGLLSADSAQFTVDTNGWFTATYGLGPQIGVQNLGFSYNAGTGTFTVHAFDGSALSAAKPAYVTLPSRTAGYSKTIKVDANQSFIDDVGASQIIGNLFGMTTGIAVTVDVPFFLYACMNDAEDTITFGISRAPNLAVAPAAANLGTPAAANADVQYGIFLFNSVTVGDYDANPVLNIGSFRMTMSASDDWTVSTLVAGRDAIGKFQETYQFTFPRGQFGAATGKIFQDNGGTAPDDSDQGMAYYINRVGECNIRLGWPLIDVAGVGAVNAILTLPYVCQNGGTGLYGRFLASGGNMSILTADTNPTTQQTAIFAYANSAADGTATNALFAANGALGLGGTIYVYRG